MTDIDWPLEIETGGCAVKAKTSPETEKAFEVAEVKPDEEAVTVKVPAPAIVKEKARTPEESD